MKTLKQIREKSVSQAQQKMMGMALAYKRGELDDASPEVKKMANSMSMKDLEDFAKTKHKGLPVKKESVELDEAKETTKLIKDLVQIVQDYHNLFSYEDDPNDEYYNAYKDALNQIEKIAGKKVRDQVDKEKPVKRMMSKSSTLDKAKSLRKYGTKKDGTANKNAIKKFKQDILNRISKHTMAMKGKLPEEVELDESKGTGVKKFVKGMRVAKTNNPNMKGTVIKGGDNMKKGVEVEWDSGTTTVASGKYLTSISKNESIEEAYKTPAEAGAFEDGKKAARKGKKYEDNPHKKGTNLHLWWSKGHNKVRESVDLEEAKISVGDIVHEVGSSITGVVQSIKNSNEVVVRYMTAMPGHRKGHFLKTLPASKLRVAEEVELGEAKISVGDRVTLQPNKNTLDRSLIGKAGVVTGMVGSKPTVKFANGKTIAVSASDLKVNESVELDEWQKETPWKKSPKVHKDKYGNVIKTKNIAKNLAKSAQKKTAKGEIDELSIDKMKDYRKKAVDDVASNTKADKRAKGVERSTMKIRRKQFSDLYRKESVDEARKSDASKDLYFDTYSAAVQTALASVKKQGFEVDEDDWHDSITTGPGKPGRGKTVRHTISLTKGGKPQRKALHIQVYNRETAKKPYELNYYVS